jgi:hypothetical protein
MGFDIAAVRSTAAAAGQNINAAHYRIEAVVSETDLDKLNALGLNWQFAQTTAKSKSARGAAGSVYHSFDEPDIGMKARIYQVAEQYPDIAKLKVFGHSINGRELLAVKLGANTKHRRKKPEVLIVATHHAREWVAAQMGIRYWII